MSLLGIPLKARDLRHITRYLSSQGAGLAVLDPSFSELTPAQWLTRATTCELTEAIEDTTKFPTLAWVDLGNNVDVASLPQPLLVSLRQRLSQ
ncbi:Leucine-Rich Repeat-Containing Protein 75B [Manis pentadactyla]|nr:Leucine-Rich Repeat-Containing Protein 75B [Manis pentadactyla]